MIAKKKVSFRAFTLIELLVVVAIIGILAAVGVVAYNGYTGAAKKAVVKSNLKTVTKFISNELMRCIVTGKIKKWSFSTGNPPLTAVDVDCVQNGKPKGSGADDFTVHWGKPFTVFSEDIKSWTNPFNANDNQGGFVGDWDPPLPEYVGRITCGKQDSWDYVNCYGRWGTGANDYDTIKINNPF